MNKTVTVNIGGMVFHIEEQAYDKLRKYLDAIRGYFTSSDGRDEILQDIESRIAEIFTEKIGTSRQVVTDADVEFMISAMGRPEQVAGEETPENSGSTQANKTFDSEERSYRKLYRDPDDKVIGGVCSGISHYLGIDPIWLRLILGVAFFFYGSGFLLYMILLIIIPKAKTTTEKLEMKGKAVNIESIRKSIEDEVTDLKNRFQESSLKNGKATHGIARFFESLGHVLLNIVRILAKIFGGIAAMILIVILISIFFLILSMTGMIGNTHFPVELSYLFLSKTQLTLSIIAIVLLIGVPVLMLLYRLIRAIFNIKSDSHLLRYISTGLWAIGFILGIYLFVSIANTYSTDEKERSQFELLQPRSQTSTLYLEGIEDQFHDNAYDHVHWEFGDAFYFNDAKDSAIITRVRLDIVQSEDSSFSLEKIITGRGSDRRDAKQNIRSVKYEIEQDDSTLKFPDHFIFPVNQHYRNQKIQLVLKVPVGKSVYLSQSIEKIIYDIKNVTNTYDGDMTGHTWTMTRAGLECLNCSLSKTSYKNKNNQFKIRVNGEEVNIDEDAADTIDWDKKDVHVRVNDNGVVIDAKSRDNDEHSKNKSW